ncbi:MAG: hypothetical protein LBR66_05560, partial [Candidatus Symbiothrix sp.]|nr:hypothetical protein [Candidatus Symbiothrix sp.]
FTALNQESSYLIYTGNGYSGYNVLTGAYGVELDPNLDKFIAPLQSFIIERDPDTGTTFEFTPAAQVTNGTYGTGNLRSIDTSDLLRITASNPSASVSTVVAQRTAGVSSHKLFDDLSATPDVYTLQGNQRFGVQLLTDNDVLLPLGLRTNYTGAMSLTFSGMDSYNARISFTDAATGVVRDLTDLDSFTYDFEYAPAADNEESRFYIQLSPKTPTGIGTAIDRVVSTEYYTLQGVRYSGSPSNGISDGTPYIVKQIYQSGKSVAKVIINK